MYNSCGDRHCLTCSGSKRAQWVEKTEALLLDGVNYFQVVFTLPKALSRLALGNRKQIYTLLFRASWQAIEKTVREEQGYEAAAALVLHTWNQRLDAHAHVHALIPGGGPSLLDPGSWKATTRRGVDSPTYLVDASQLRRNYRDFFLAGLELRVPSQRIETHWRVRITHTCRVLGGLDQETRVHSLGRLHPAAPA